MFSIEVNSESGDRFVEKVSNEVKEKDIEPGGPRVGFNRLIEAVAGHYGVSKEALSGSGRREDWVAGRRLLVYVARSWSEMTTGEIESRFMPHPTDQQIPARIKT